MILDVCYAIGGLGNPYPDDPDCQEEPLAGAVLLERVRSASEAVRAMADLAGWAHRRYGNGEFYAQTPEGERVDVHRLESQEQRRLAACW